MNETIKILIADDHPIVRQGLRQTIEADERLSVVGEAGDGAEAVVAVERLDPDILLLDVDMPKMDGFQVANTLAEKSIDVKIIFLTVHREESFLRKALGLNAVGYILKDSAIADIISAIDAVRQGLPFVSPAMTAYLVKPKTSKPVDGIGSLTPAERRILRLVAQYKTTKEIAEMLFISPRTVESHRATIMQKLGLHGSHSLMRYALQHVSEIEDD
jgi:DNA-binding NarL/FixJ family response regulator